MGHTVEKTSSKLSLVGGIAVASLEKILFGPIPVLSGSILIASTFDPAVGFFSDVKSYNGADNRYHYRCEVNLSAALCYIVGASIIYTPQIIKLFK